MSRAMVMFHLYSVSSILVNDGRFHVDYLLPGAFLSYPRASQPISKQYFFGTTVINKNVAVFSSVITPPHTHT